LIDILPIFEYIFMINSSRIVMDKMTELILMFVAFILILNFLGTLMFNSILGARVEESLKNNQPNPHFDSKKHRAKATMRKWSLLIVSLIILYWVYQQIR